MCDKIIAFEVSRALMSVIILIAAVVNPSMANLQTA